MTKTDVRAKPTLDAARRAEIDDFIADSVHCIDDDRLEDWPAFFAEDAFYQVISRESYEAGLPIGVMLCQGRGMIEDRMRALRQANIYEQHSYCHLLGRTRLEEEGAGRYRARTNFNVTRTMQDGGSEIFATGKYLDVIVADGTALKLQERYVVLESRRIDILLVIPL